MPDSIIGSYATIKSSKTHELIAIGLIIDRSQKILTVRTFDCPQNINNNIEFTIRSFSNDFYLCSGDIVAIENNAIYISNIDIISDNERRRSERVRFQEDALFISKYIQTDLVGNLQNISTTGFLFKTDMSLPHNDELSIQFPITSISNKLEILTAKAQIVRRNGNLYGCRFTEISAYDLKTIKNIVVKNSPQTRFFRKNIM